MSGVCMLGVGHYSDWPWLYCIITETDLSLALLEVQHFILFLSVMSR